MQYVIFSSLFIVAHIVAYTIAGVISYRVSQDLYEGDTRLLDFMKDMGNESENASVSKLVFPSQILRGLLLSIVLYPLIGFLGDLSFIVRFLFFAGLMFFYTDFACAILFPHNIEGFVYFKEKYLVRKGAFWKLQYEMIIYTILFGLLASWMLFIW